MKELIHLGKAGLIEWKAIILPNDGINEVLSFLRSATSTIDCKHFKLIDPSVIQELVNAQKRGIAVRVMLNPKRSDGTRVNDQTFSILQEAGVVVQWTSPKFVVTHEKTITIDNARILIATFNMCSSCLTKVRDYALITNDPDIVSGVQRCYKADWNQEEFQPTPDCPLLWSNVNSREKTIGFIDMAKKTLDIQHPKLADAPILDRLLAAHARGVRVRFLCGGGSGLSQWDYLDSFSSWRILQRSGIKLRIQKKPKLHAKLIVADEKRMLLSSFNMDRSAFDLRREFGIITDHPQAVERLHSQFHSDWNKARPFKVPDPMVAFSLSKSEKDKIPELTHE
jgi:cardiolipin synthase A/B